MAKFYIVAREAEDYSLITVEDGNHLEDIDILTNKFSNKEEFINYLNKRGYHFSDNVDLFVVNKGRKEIYHRELIYGNYDLTVLAKRSKDGKLDVTDTCNILLQKAQEDFEFQDLIRKDTFELYGELRTMILNSLRNRRIRIAPSKNWMRHNYYVGRDSIVSIDIFEKEKSKFETTEEFSHNRKELKKQRQLLDKYLDKKIDCDNEQISLIGEPKDYINLTYVNTEKIKNEPPKKIKKDKKFGFINDKLFDKLTIPFDVITDDIDYRLVNNIADCILKLPYHKIPWGKKERYEIDFKKWSKYSGIECNEYDAKFLNSLLETSLRQNSYWRNFYASKEHSTPAILSEKRRYQKSVYTTLINAAKNKNDTYKKAYNFYLIYQAMVNDFNKNDNRGGYGRK